MAKAETHWFSNKLRHIGSTMWDKAKTFGATGVVVGAVFGVGAAVFGGAALLPVVAGGMLYCGLLGVELGAVWGGIKGMLTRPEPKAADIMEEAGECGTVVEQAKQAGMAQGLMAPMIAPQMAAPEAIPTQPTAPKMTAPTVPQQEISQLTDALSRMQAEAVSGAPPPPSAEQGSWRERVSQQVDNFRNR